MVIPREVYGLKPKRCFKCFLVISIPFALLLALGAKQEHHRHILGGLSLPIVAGGIVIIGILVYRWCSRRSWKRTVGRITRYEEIDDPERGNRHIARAAFTLHGELCEMADTARWCRYYEIGDQVTLRYPDDATYYKAEIDSPGFDALKVAISTAVICAAYFL